LPVFGQGPNAGQPDLPSANRLRATFTDEDLSPPGSWAKRAAANVDAVELVKKLEA
jgi:hypothetical protein